MIFEESMNAERNKQYPEESLAAETMPSNAGGDKVPQKLPIGGASSDGGCRRWGDPTGLNVI